MRPIQLDSCIGILEEWMKAGFSFDIYFGIYAFDRRIPERCCWIGSYQKQQSDIPTLSVVRLASVTRWPQQVENGVGWRKVKHRNMKRRKEKSPGYFKFEEFGEIKCLKYPIRDRGNKMVAVVGQNLVSSHYQIAPKYLLLNGA
ncbi:MAG: hypothetical protein ACR2M9_02510 [Cyanophyceae cyanobacterium]